MRRPRRLARVGWGVAAALALLWPARLAAPLDGIPLDGAAEAILVGVVFPALWWYAPAFLDRRGARSLIVALLAWKALLASTVAQDGWCIRFDPPVPVAKNAPGAPHSWDLRADWRSPDPACSAIVTRRYEGLGDFPAWFFNLPPASDGWPGPADRPPGATTPAAIRGYLRTERAGTLAIDIGADMDGTLAVDGIVAARGTGGRLSAPVGAGTHAVDLRMTLRGEAWRLAPSWNSRDLWSASMATVGRPAAADRWLRPWGRWIAPGLVAGLLAPWTGFAARVLDDPDLITWAVAASGWLGILAATGHDLIARGSVVFLSAAALVPIRRRWWNTTGLFVAIGIPWLAMIVALSADQIGRWRLYDVGSDFWTFQRAAYRIVMLGYWLEGGSLTFWFQPLYRWFAGLLHVVFGDSSVGETYWDAACVLAGASLAFEITKRVRGFAWAIAAAVLVLALFALANPWQHVGRGLSEITSAGLLSVAALLTMRSRHGNRALAVTAGALAALAFYTRLNNLPMAFATAVFAIPSRVPASALATSSRWIRRVSWPIAATIVGTVTVAVVLFAWRTWHYTGVFSVTYGTQSQFLAVWKPGMRLADVAGAMASSVMMVLTMNDPPRVDAYAIPLLIGASAAALAIAGVPRLNRLPLAPVLFCLSGLVGALIARGSAYEGRFSVHVIPVASALAVCAVSMLVGGRRIARRAQDRGPASPRRDDVGTRTP